MTSHHAYRNIARIAAECEQRGWYERPLKFGKILKLARAVDTRGLNPYRVCVNAAARCW